MTSKPDESDVLEPAASRQEDLAPLDGGRVEDSKSMGVGKQKESGGLGKLGFALVAIAGGGNLLGLMALAADRPSIHSDWSGFAGGLAARVLLFFSVAPLALGALFSLVGALVGERWGRRGLLLAVALAVYVVCAFKVFSS